MFLSFLKAVRILHYLRNNSAILIPNLIKIIVITFAICSILIFFLITIYFLIIFDYGFDFFYSAFVFVTAPDLSF